jgi:hypothetical protein
MHGYRLIAWTGCLAALALCGCGGQGTPWREIAPESMDSALQTRAEKAQAARAALFDALKGRLTEVVGASGTAAAIAVCKEEAPELARRVSMEQGVVIGRTAVRLRNPGNAAPDWARPYIERGIDRPLYLHHADTGELAVLLPIRLMPECLQCHGPAEHIPAEVRERLAAEYPDDAATGFKVGDLRGWFHILVPPMP